MFDPDFSYTADEDVLTALSSQFLLQLGFLLILPIPLLIAVEQVYTCTYIHVHSHLRAKIQSNTTRVGMAETRFVHLFVFLEGAPLSSTSDIADYIRSC